MGNLIKHGLDAYKKTINLDTKTNNDFIKTSKPPKALKIDEKKDPPKDSKVRRAAKFFILIGSEQAAEILAKLDPGQVEEISKEITQVKKIAPEEANDILKEFHDIFSKSYSLTGSSHGGIEAARRILYAAKGPEKGESLLNRAVPESKENLFSFLEEFSPEQLAVIIKAETTQTAALILSRLSPKLSADILKKIPPEDKPEILKRIAYQKEVSPEVLEQITAALREKVRHVSGGANDLTIDGMQALAAILKQGDYAFGDRIVSELEQTSPDIGKDLKDKLYTLDDVIYTVDRPIQEKLSIMSEQEIAVLLKGKKREFNEKILSCVSAGRRQIIREESEVIGAVPKRDIDVVTSEFLSWFRKARERGEIILLSDEDVLL